MSTTIEIDEADTEQPVVTKTNYFDNFNIPGEFLPDGFTRSMVRTVYKVHLRERLVGHVFTIHDSSGWFGASTIAGVWGGTRKAVVTDLVRRTPMAKVDKIAELNAELHILRTEARALEEEIKWRMSQ